MFNDNSNRSSSVFTALNDEWVVMVVEVVLPFCRGLETCFWKFLFVCKIFVISVASLHSSYSNNYYYCSRHVCVIKMAVEGYIFALNLCLRLYQSMVAWYEQTHS